MTWTGGRKTHSKMFTCNVLRHPGSPRSLTVVELPERRFLSCHIYFLVLPTVYSVRDWKKKKKNPESCKKNDEKSLLFNVSYVFFNRTEQNTNSKCFIKQ